MRSLEKRRFRGDLIALSSHLKEAVAGRVSVSPSKQEVTGQKARASSCAREGSGWISSVSSSLEGL